MRNKRATQSETLLHIQPRPYACYVAFSTYSDVCIHTQYDNETESPRCQHPHMQEEKRAEKSWKTTHFALPVIHFSSFVSQNEPNQKNLHVEKVSHPSRLSFILPFHCVETSQEIGLAILNPHVQVIYSDTQIWQKNGNVTSCAPPTCFHVSNFLCQQCEEKNLNVESWGSGGGGLL